MHLHCLVPGLKKIVFPGCLFVLLLLFAQQKGYAHPFEVDLHENGSSNKVQVVVKGVVKNLKGMPIVGASVQLSGSQIGTITGQDGGFSLQLPSSDGTLLVSAVGYKKSEVLIEGRTFIPIQLLEDSTDLKDVVVIGYGSKQKATVTGSIAQIDSKTFESRSLTNVSSALQGALPGLSVLRSSGQPGREGFNLQVRGVSSVNGSAPLVLIDGIAGNINSLNPSDIASVTVLKDAAASIYGARAADGVILIVTKKGQSGKLQLNYTGNMGVKTPDYLKDVTTTLQFAEMSNEGLTNMGLPGVPADVMDKIRKGASPDPDKGWVTFLQDYPGFYQDNDWNKILYGSALQQMHNLSITGGGNNSNFLFSAGYGNDNGIFNYGKNRSDRYNLRMNYDFTLFDKLHIQTRNSYINELIAEPSSWEDVMHNTPRMFNFVPLYNPLGQYYTYQGYVNPAQELAEGGDRNTNYNEFSFNVKADIEVLKGLRVTGQFGVKNSNMYDNQIYKTFTEYTYDGSTQGLRNPLNSASYANSRNLYKSYTLFADYDHRFGAFHHFNLMAGSSIEKNKDLGTTATGSNFPGNSIFTLNLADKTKAEYTSLWGLNTDWALNSYFGRFSYDYASKLFLDATLRIDGSSKFSPAKRWSAVFPSVSVAYNLAKESFLENLHLFDLLKLRASFGQAGNQEISAFGNYGYIPLVDISGSYPLGKTNVGVPGAVSGIASEDRTWETIETRNLGLDFGLLSNRLTGSLDVYQKDNRNMLVNVQVPVTLGGTPPSQNLGHLTTKGFDLSLGWKDQIGKFKYSITAILSDSKNKLVELKGNDVLVQGLNYAHQGYSLNSYFGYEYTGIIQNQQQLDAYKKLGNIPSAIGIGDVMFKDVDGDGKLTAYGDPAKGSKGDLVYLGSLMPRYVYSTNIDLSYGNFDLSVFLQGVGKNDNIRDGSFAIPLSAIYFQPLKYFYGKSWTPQNTTAKYPRLIPGDLGFSSLMNYDWQYSSMRVDNLAYLRFKVITLGYNLSSTLCQKLKIASAKVYISGQDLFTISKDTWGHSYDPEEGYLTSDETTYPFSKVLSFGVNIHF